jgi:ABC-type uncharacterized transport system permease subunit
MQHLALLKLSFQNALKRRNIYTGSFLVGGISVFLTNSVLFLSVASLFSFFKDLTQLNMAQMVLLYGISFVGVALARISSSGLDHFADNCHLGSLDAFLLKPLPLGFQIFCHDFLLRLLVPISLWIILVAGACVALKSEIQILLLAYLPVKIFLLAFILHKLQAWAYTLCFYFPKTTALGELLDPLIDFISKIPMELKSLAWLGGGGFWVLSFVRALGGAPLDSHFFVSEGLFIALAAFSHWGGRQAMARGLHVYASGDPGSL